MRRVGLTVAVLCLLCPPLLAQGKFPLKYEEAGPGNDAVVQMNSPARGMNPRKPDEITGLPDGLPETAAYCQMSFGDKRIWMAALVGDAPKLYVDTDGDNDLSDETAIAGQVEGNRVKYAIADLPVSGGATVKVRCEATFRNTKGPAQVLSLRAAGCPAGKATLGGKTYAVAVIDGTFNGHYNDIIQDNPNDLSSGSADGLAIDLDQDGQFARPSPTGKAWEWTLLCKMVEVGGTYYTVRVAPDGSEIEFQKTEPKFGTLDMGGPGVDIIAMSEAGFQRVNTADGKARLPAGKYMPVTLTLTQTDDAGATWMLRQSGGEFRQFEIRPDEALAVKLGPPLLAKTDVRQSGKTVLIIYALLGQAGEQYSPGAMKDKTMLPPPAVEILDEARKVIYAGKFEYG
ncbi:MAG TPA: hypothetical protein VM238_11645 [Phycisphaerae bacterium]|nr:hypothetical protein [Phycisphaerae bacterium]